MQFQAFAGLFNGRRGSRFFLDFGHCYPSSVGFESRSSYTIRALPGPM